MQGLSDSQEGKPSTEACLEGDMGVHLKLPIFKGASDEDMDHFWFVADSIWTAQGLVSDTMKKTQLSLAIEDRALDWYMRYIS